jgi:iron(III) transport system substrate-binding protein
MRHNDMRRRLLSALGAVLLLAACGQSDDATPASAADEAVVNVYSSRHYDTDLRLDEDFTATTGIRVNRIEAGADELILRMC